MTRGEAHLGLVTVNDCGLVRFYVTVDERVDVGPEATWFGPTERIVAC